MGDCLLLRLGPGHGRGRGGEGAGGAPPLHQKGTVPKHRRHVGANSEDVGPHLSGHSLCAQYQILHEAYSSIVETGKKGQMIDRETGITNKTQESQGVVKRETAGLRLPGLQHWACHLLIL